jgi:hypothetical protein
MSTHKLMFVIVACVAFALSAAYVAGAHGNGAGWRPGKTTPGKTTPAESVLVVRDEGAHDTLWLVSPKHGTATPAGKLPGHAGTVAVAPDGQNVAYLPRSGSPRVWIRYGSLGPRTISLKGIGVRKVHSLTWISATKLLVSGAKTGKQPDPYKDRLYVANAVTGKVGSFRKLRGTEPSAAPAAGKVAYVKLTTLSPGNRRKGTAPLILESLKILSLTGSGAGRTIDSRRYRLDVDQRAFRDPKLSSTADWLMFEQTGSDVSVTYTIRPDTLDEPILTLFTTAFWAEAGWDAAGQRSAFVGKLWTQSGYQACVWVYDVETGAMTRTPRGLLPDMVIANLAWSEGGDLVAEADDYDSGDQRVIVMPGDDLSSITDRGEGSFPVWVRP